MDATTVRFEPAAGRVRRHVTEDAFAVAIDAGDRFPVRRCLPDLDHQEPSA